MYCVSPSWFSSKAAAARLSLVVVLCRPFWFIHVLSANPVNKQQITCYVLYL